MLYPPLQYILERVLRDMGGVSRTGPKAIAYNCVIGWLVHGPLGSAFHFSIYAPSSVRALLTVCDVLGALGVATFFMSVSGGGRSKRNPPACNDFSQVAEMLGQMIAQGFALQQGLSKNWGAPTSSFWAFSLHPLQKSKNQKIRKSKMEPQK